MKKRNKVITLTLLSITLLTVGIISILNMLYTPVKDLSLNVILITHGILLLSAYLLKEAISENTNKDSKPVMKKRD